MTFERRQAQVQWIYIGRIAKSEQRVIGDPDASQFLLCISN